MSKYIETHCHLDYLKAFPLEEILQKSHDVGVEKIITIAVEPDNLKTVRDLASQYDQVYCTQGVHPHDASKVNDQVLKDIKSFAKSFNKCLAIGEIGLDYHYDNSPRDVQREMFRKQLDIACDIDLPIVVHTREAEDDTKDILGEYAPKLKRKGVIHSFTSSVELAEFCVGLGFYIGLNGIITFKNAHGVRDVLKAIPLEQILIETDSPFLTPVPHRGKENGPYYLPHVAEKVAEIKEISLKEVQEITYQNAVQLFDLK